MDDKITGSWLIHHTQRLQRMENQRGYERVYKAGKAGILLSALSSDKQHTLTKERVTALATAANINTIFELPELLRTLKERDLVDFSTSEISVLGVTTQSTLAHTASIFSSIEPAANEKASILLAEAASSVPISQKEALDIGDQLGMTQERSRQTIEDATEIGFIDAEPLPGGERVFFNGNLFRRDETEKIKRVLDSLPANEASLVNEAKMLLQEKSCVEVADIERILGKSLFSKIMAVGLFDLNIVSNSREETGFVTLPAAFRKYSTSLVEDAFDLAKAFVSSITYGMTKSSSQRGRIDLVTLLLKALIRGEAIGPVPAIAEDYKLLELKGVVRVANGSKNGRRGPMMRLLKKEVGELALQVITQGDASEHSLDALPSAAITRYRGPEENQQRARKSQRRESPSATNDILRALRTTGAN